MLLTVEHAKPRRGAVQTPEYQYMLKRLGTARQARGLTQDAVAKALRRQQSYVTKCELGERRIDPIDLARFTTPGSPPWR